MTPFQTCPNGLPAPNNSALPDVLLADALQTNKEKNQQSKMKRNWTKTPQSKASKPFSELNRQAWIDWLGLTTFQWCTLRKVLAK